MNGRAIGIFDSGMGGLTVLRALEARLPRERFLYLGDTARLPYGTKSPDTVRRYAIQASRELIARDVKLIVVACNTASVAAAALQEAVAPVPVLGVIEPGAAAARNIAPEGPIAVIATEGAVKGGAYVRAIQAGGTIPVVQQACPLFVPLTEEGLIAGPIVEAVVHRYLAPLMATMPRPRCLLLGCTHYPVLAVPIARAAGADTQIVDSAATTAEAVAALLAERDLARDGEAGGASFLATDAPDRFARVGEIFLGRPIDPGSVELVDL
jgi:glutamate racemase